MNLPALGFFTLDLHVLEDEAEVMLEGDLVDETVEQVRRLVRARGESHVSRGRNEAKVLDVYALFRLELEPSVRQE